MSNIYTTSFFPTQKGTASTYFSQEATSSIPSLSLALSYKSKGIAKKMKTNGKMHQLKLTHSKNEITDLQV